MTGGTKHNLEKQENIILIFFILESDMKAELCV